MNETQKLQDDCGNRASARIYETHHDCGGYMPLHRHNAAYASLIVSGDYIEYGVDGRIEVTEGDIIIHPPFNAHGDLFPKRRARVLNVELSGAMLPGAAFVACASNTSALLDALLGQPDRAEQIILEEATSVGRRRAPVEGPAITRPAADAWRYGERMSVREASVSAGVSAEYFSRLFKSHYGVSPVAYRSEWRFRHALSAIAGGCSLAKAATHNGYSDQSHMTRDFNARASQPPGAFSA